jgi:hypothetical protein
MIYGERLGYELHVWDSRHVIDGEIARDRSRCTYSRVFSYQSRSELGITVCTSLIDTQQGLPAPWKRERQEEHDVWYDKVAMCWLCEKLGLSPPTQSRQNSSMGLRWSTLRFVRNLRLYEALEAPQHLFIQCILHRKRIDSIKTGSSWRPLQRRTRETLVGLTETTIEYCRQRSV